jgi:hypothetical protein
LDPFFRDKCTASLICIRFAVLSKVSNAKVLAHNCMGLLPVYEFPSSKYHYPLATMVANLAKLTPDRPALIPRDDDRQAHESGLNNLGVRCQRASKAVAVMVCRTQRKTPRNPALISGVHCFITQWFTSPSRVSPVP